MMKFKLFKNTSRSQALRSSILESFVGLLMSDDERARMLGLPTGCRIRENAKIISRDKFRCGKYVWIGEGALLDASGELTIGEHTTICPYVCLWTHTDYLENLALENYTSYVLSTKLPVTIGDGCFIGSHSVIQPGVNIGNRVVVQPKSFVDTDIKDNCVVGGNPLKVIREFTDDDVRTEVDELKAKYGRPIEKEREQEKEE